MKRVKYDQQKFYILMLFHQVSRLCKLEVKADRTPILEELQNKLVLVRRFDHLRLSFIHDFQDNFLIDTIIHLQHQQILIWKQDFQSNSLEISKKTSLISAVGLPKAVYISWTIDNSWAVHESPGNKPECEEIKSLLLGK